MACYMTTNNFAHPIVTGFSTKDSMLFGCYKSEGGAIVDDALGELWEEEIVWGEAEVHQSAKDSAAAGEHIHGKVGMKIMAARQRSLLSRQIEMQANTWAPGSTLSAVFAAKQSSKGKAAPDHQDHEVEVDGCGEEGGLLNGLIPPHELLARQYAASASKSFSVLHGAGRTLKGMDLRRLRNEVWRQTGYMD